MDVTGRLLNGGNLMVQLQNGKSSALLNGSEIQTSFAIFHKIRNLQYMTPAFQGLS
jgi:hypothetical protein